MKRMLKFVIKLVALIGTVQCLVPPQAEGPLYLTPYIENNQTETAQLLSRVWHPDLLLKNIVSYSGFLTVNKEFNSNLFFWYFPARKNSRTAPLVLWLQGGPGGASIYGMFMENGPVFINPDTIRMEKREFSWNEEHNVVYIDNPVGCGFSFTDSNDGYLNNQVDIGQNLFEAVYQFLKLFPELRRRDFYLTGESYAGKYIPSLAYTIYQNRNDPNPNRRINLKGFAIGNGVTDPINQLVFGELSHALGLIDDNARQIFNQREAAATKYILEENYLPALLATFSLINTPGSLFNNLTGFTSPFNYLKQHGYDDGIEAVDKFMSTSGVERYLHVGKRPFVPFATPNVVLANLMTDIMRSVAPWLAELVDNYRVFIYNGQLDVLAGPMAAQQYLSKLEFGAAAEYRAAERLCWIVDGEVAGYVKQGGNLSEITIRNAGHMVPVDQPKWAYDLLTRLTGVGFQASVKSSIGQCNP